MFFKFFLAFLPITQAEGWCPYSSQQNSSPFTPTNIGEWQSPITWSPFCWLPHHKVGRQPSRWRSPCIWRVKREVADSCTSQSCWTLTPPAVAHLSFFPLTTLSPPYNGASDLKVASSLLYLGQTEDSLDYQVTALSLETMRKAGERAEDLTFCCIYSLKKWRGKEWSDKGRRKCKEKKSAAKFQHLQHQVRRDHKSQWIHLIDRKVQYGLRELLQRWQETRTRFTKDNAEKAINKK